MKALKGCLTMIVLAVVVIAIIGVAVTNKAVNHASEAQSSTPAPTPPAQPAILNYTVETKEQNDLTQVQVTFNRLPATEAEAAKIVRDEMNKVVARDGSKEILAMAFSANDEALPDEKYGGALTYSPKDGTVKTMQQLQGLNSFTHDRDGYFSKMEEQSTYAGITPARKWLDISVVFPAAPTPEQFEAAARKEIEIVKGRKVDVNVYGFAGDKNNSASWEQVRSASGHFMEANYTANNGGIDLK